MAQENRIWRKGPPPHVGWWNASLTRSNEAWRWWSGKWWGDVVYPDDVGPLLVYAAVNKVMVQSGIEWTDYWHENARVPRINPESL